MFMVVHSSCYAAFFNLFLINCLSIITYGVIFIHETGHLFHIDFGHFLGNFKKKFGYKRERAPFVFTPSMATILGGSEKGVRYLRFKELCCQAFLTLRKHTNVLLTLFSLMVDCGIPELQKRADIEWMRRALMVGVSDEEATHAFLDLITESLECRTTLVNHACHLLKVTNKKLCNAFKLCSVVFCCCYYCC